LELEYLDRYFDEKCSSLFDDEDGDPFGISSEKRVSNSPREQFKSDLPSFWSIMKDDFGLDDPFVNNKVGKGYPRCYYNFS